MNFESTNVFYAITCMKCLQQYVDSATKFKSRFRIHKSDQKTKKDRCGTARYFNDQCCHFSNLFVYSRFRLIEDTGFMMTAILKIFYGTEKNIGSPNYLKM